MSPEPESRPTSGGACFSTNSVWTPWPWCQRSVRC